MNDITINKKHFSFPSSWRELSTRQIIKIAPVLLGARDTLAIRRAVVLFFFAPQLRRYWTRHPLVTRLMRRFPTMEKRYPLFTDAQKWDLLQSVDYLFRDVNGVAILRSFKHDDTTYYLPEDNFTKESIIAFAFADEYFNRFVETNDESFLNLLIACIARQRGSKMFPALQFVEGDIREHFSTSRTIQRAKSFKTLDTRIRSTILIYFLGSKKFIHKQYEILFKQDRDEKKETTIERNDVKQRMKTFGKKKIPAPNFNWLGVVYELSETGAFGDFDRVKHMFLHTCCYYLAKKRYEKEENSA